MLSRKLRADGAQRWTSRWGLALLGIGAVLPHGGCGARTDLPPRTSCRVEGEVIACQDTCGEGISTCESGRWSECRVDNAVRPCSDGCGPGEERCVAGVWGECEVPRQEIPCATKCGPGVIVCENGVRSECDAPVPLPPALRVVLRDFQDTHPDFERMVSMDAPAYEPGLLAKELGPDDKPVFLGPSYSITSAATFDQWYRDVPGVNLTKADELQLVAHPIQEGLYFYNGLEFFPLDGELFGNQGRPHNYHFTLEAHASFTYRGGEVFRFDGDDDFWVFVNRRLAIDLGGLHPPRSAFLVLDDVAGDLGLVRDQVFPLDLFFAERHTFASDFTIQTTLNDIGPCP